MRAFGLVMAATGAATGASALCGQALAMDSLNAVFDRVALASAPFETTAHVAESSEGAAPDWALGPAPQVADLDASFAPDTPVFGEEGLTRRRTGQVALADGAGRLRISLDSEAQAVGGAFLARPDSLMEAQALALDVTYLRDWPSAVRLKAGAYDLDLTPHAGLGLSSGGAGSAEAGATLRFGLGLDDSAGAGSSMRRRLNALVRDGGEFENEGRWYLFAAASGRAVGFNMRRSEDGDWSRAGLSTDTAATTIADTQAGVAWRKGGMQAAFGYMRREVKAEHGLDGVKSKDDSVVALSFSIKPNP